MKRLILFIVAIIVISCIVISVYIFKPFPFFKSELIISSKFKPMTLENDTAIHFYKDGIILSDSSHRFYNWNGKEAEAPFPDDFNPENPFGIFMSTKSTIATDNGIIFDITNSPFKKIYDNSDITFLDIKDYGEFLLVLTKGAGSSTTPYLLVKGSDFLLSIDGLGTTHYLASDCHIETKELSILSLNVDNPLPETHVFHYKNMNQPYGLLSIDDTIVYNINRLKDKVILICSNEVLCYNIEGDNSPVWKVKKARNSSFQTIKTADSLVIYFNDTYLNNSNEYNAVFINNKGEYELKSLPRFMSGFQSFRGGFVGLEYDNTIILLDKRGRVLSKNRLPMSVKSLHATEYNTNAFYCITNDLQLIMLTTEKERNEEA